MKRSKKQLPQVDIISYGRYERWNTESRELPELLELTDAIEAEADAEFGLIVEIRQGKGRYLEYTINHPPYPDRNGNVTPPFTGNHQIKSNPFLFFLGDSIQNPVYDKKGDWEFLISIDQQVVARKILNII